MFHAIPTLYIGCWRVANTIRIDSFEIRNSCTLRTVISRSWLCEWCIYFGCNFVFYFGLDKPLGMPRIVFEYFHNNNSVCQVVLLKFMAGCRIIRNWLIFMFSETAYKSKRCGWHGNKLSAKPGIRKRFL